MCVRQRITYGSRFSLSILWVPGIRLRLSGLEAYDFMDWTFLLPSFLLFIQSSIPSQGTMVPTIGLLTNILHPQRLISNILHPQRLISPTFYIPKCWSHQHTTSPKVDLTVHPQRLISPTCYIPKGWSHHTSPRVSHMILDLIQIKTDLWSQLILTEHNVTLAVNCHEGFIICSPLKKNALWYTT